MILTCPECATSYFADDAAIGEGRKVRCASCGVAWFATAPQEEPLELTVSPDEGAMGRAATAAAPAEDEDLFERPAAEIPAEELPKAFRARAQKDRVVREAAVQGAVWAGMGAALTALVIVAVVYRMDVVRIWPKSASAYAAVGLKVNPVGLTIEDVHALPSLQDGRPVLVVSGVMRNVRAHAVMAPPLSITLLDKDGRKLLQRTSSPGDPLVPPGQTRNFAVSLIDPPAAATDLDVTFRAGAVRAPRAAVKPVSVARLRPKASTPAPSALMLGPVQEAKPLPKGSPYALSSAPAAAPAAAPH